MVSLLKPTAVAVVVTTVAATAAAISYVSTPLTAGFLSSPPFLWVAANVIVLWLLSSSRRCKDNTTSAADVLVNAVDDLFPTSEYEGSDATDRRAEAPVPKRRQGREARTARRADRHRVRRKSAGEEAPGTTAAAEARFGPDHKMRATVAAAAEAKNDAGDGDDADVSIDSLWQSIVQRRGARPVAVRKSETWGSDDELPRLQRQRVAETAAARREEMHKSVSAVDKATEAAHPPAPAPSAARKLGQRTREVLVMAQDELLRRAESLIRRHHEHLRLQRQESEQRHALELQRHRPAAALIRV